MESDSERGLGDTVSVVSPPLDVAAPDEPPARASATVLPRLEHVAGKPLVVAENLPRYEEVVRSQASHSTAAVRRLLDEEFDKFAVSSAGATGGELGD